ncbi:MAG: ABC transporter ATP-binding protein, partial [Candidatus Stahlbacteria bacterium]|nr:ABC transporter ATP-binding protein [Candidatus Stahlbacteria bacterium]
GEISFRLFHDPEVIQQSFNSLINMAISIFLIIVIGALMTCWNYELSIFVFLVSFVQSIVVRKFRYPLIHYAQLMKTKNEKLSGNVIEYFGKIELLKTIDYENREEVKFRTSLLELIKIRLKEIMLTKGAGIIVSVVNNIWAFGILWYGGIKVIRGDLTMGSLMAFLLLSNNLYPCITSITNTVLSFQDVTVSIRRFFDFYAREPHICDAKDAISLSKVKGKVELCDVSFRYDSGPLVLDRINAEIAPNTIIALIGKSGIGKTTFCKLIARIYDPTEGNIKIDGIDIKKIKLSFLRKEIGILLQNKFIFSGTVEENIFYPVKNYNRDAIIEASKKAYAYDFIMQLPDGYNTKIGEGGVTLSDGEAQRIALARVFLQSPKIVLLDEPTSFIDLNTEAKIQQSLLIFKENASVIIIDHRVSTMKIADKIFRLDEGKIVEEGKYEELVLRDRVYKNLADDFIEQKSEKEKV